MSRWLLIALLFLPQSAAPTQLATVAGVVVLDDPSSTAVPDAAVVLSGGALESDLQVKTNADGAFEFYGLAAGSYRVSAQKTGLVATAYGAKRAGSTTGAPVSVGAGEKITVTLVLSRGSTVTGRVLGANGQALPGATVAAIRSRSLVGDRASLPAATAVVDQRGEYQIIGLSPGDYIIVATPRRDLAATALAGAAQTSRPTGSPPMYFPGSTDPMQATPVALTAGQTRGGMDFRLVSQPLMRIAGRVVYPDGKPAVGLQVAVTPLAIPSAVRSLFPPRTLRIEEDGVFSVAGFYAGRYSIAARAAAPAQTDVGPTSNVARSWWGMAEVTVGTEDLTSLVITVNPGTTVTGRVVFAGSTQTPPVASATHVTLMPISSGFVNNVTLPPSRMSPDGTFTVDGVAPGRYRLSAVNSSSDASRRWEFESATWNGNNVRDLPIDVSGSGVISDVIVTFTDTPTELTGRLTDAGGRPALGYFVFVFPADPALRTAGSSRLRPPGQPTADGRFSMIGLPPGDYFVVALEDYDSADLADAAFLEAASKSAVRVTLIRGQKTTQDLRLR